MEWNAHEIAEEALRRAEAARKKRRKRRRNIALAAGGLFVCVIASLTYILPGGGFFAPEGGTAAVVGSITDIENAAIGGYFIAAIAGFTLGTAVTLICMRARKKIQGRSEI